MLSEGGYPACHDLRARVSSNHPALIDKPTRTNTNGPIPTFPKMSASSHPTLHKYTPTPSYPAPTLVNGTHLAITSSHNPACR